MTSSAVLQENAKNRPQNDSGGKSRGISVLMGVLWMVGAAGVWILLLVLLHNAMARLLS